MMFLISVLAFSYLMAPVKSIWCDNTIYPNGTFYVKEGDCKNYYECVDNERITHTCDNDLVFSHQNNGCVETSVYSECSCYPNHQQESLWLSCDAYQQCGHYVYCSPGKYFNQLTGYCDWSENVLECSCANEEHIIPASGYPQPFGEDCSQFTQCNNTLTCPSGKVFDSNLGYCRDEENVPECWDCELTTTSTQVSLATEIISETETVTETVTTTSTVTVTNTDCQTIFDGKCCQTLNFNDVVDPGQNLHENKGYSFLLADYNVDPENGVGFKTDSLAIISRNGIKFSAFGMKYKSIDREVTVTDASIINGIQIGYTVVQQLSLQIEAYDGQTHLATNSIYPPEFWTSSSLINGLYQLMVDNATEMALKIVPRVKSVGIHFFGEFNSRLGIQRPNPCGVEAWAEECVVAQYIEQNPVPQNLEVHFDDLFLCYDYN